MPNQGKFEIKGYSVVLLFFALFKEVIEKIRIQCWNPLFQNSLNFEIGGERYRSFFEATTYVDFLGPIPKFFCQMDSDNVSNSMPKPVPGDMSKQ